MLIIAIMLFGARVGAEPERFTLDNGVRVVLNHVDDAGSIAVIAAYDTGFSSDPAGAPQAAHLAEHLRCTSATESWDAGVSFARLNERGGANAETLASLTYYDMILPSDGLALALRVESERLGSLRITREDIAREGPRAAAELAGADQSPQRFVGKFALMALIQGWTHNATHVNLMTALEQTPIGTLRPVLDRHAPQSLTLIITGEFDPAEARQRINATLAALPRTEAPPALAPIDWQQQPQTRRMTWDSTTTVVAIACPAPADPVERAVLTGLGFVAHMTSNSVEGVLSLHTSGQTAPVGAIPFHVLAAIDDNADPQAVIDALHDRLDAIIKNVPLYKSQLTMILREPPRMNADQLRAQVQAIARMQSITEQDAMGLALGNMALQSLMRERAGGDAIADAIDALTPEQLRDIAARSLARDQRRVTILSPRTPAPRP